MRFSFWPVAQQTYADILTLCQHAERGGWDGIWFADHFMPNAPHTEGPCHEVWTMLGALAAQVPRVRLGPLVIGNTYRHPAVVANMASTLDHVSGGRLVLGMGAGWQVNEHEAYGIELYAIGERLRIFEEACEIIRSLLTQPRTDFSGRFYQLRDAPMEPKPVQARVPLMIGGGGEKVTLRIVARLADEWNVWGDVATLEHKSAVLERHCQREGRDPSDIARSAAALVHLSDDVDEVRRLTETPQPRPTIAGNVTQLQDVLGAYARVGVDELIVPDFHLAQGAGQAKQDFMSRFIEDVAPALR